MHALVRVPGLGGPEGDFNAGYCEVLKELLEGGENLVRLAAQPVNWYFNEFKDASFRRTSALLWKTGITDLEWTTGGTELLWMYGEVLSGNTGTLDGIDFVTVTGLPASTLIAKPGEYVTGRLLSDPHGVGSTAMVLKPAYSNGAGTARIFLLSALAYDELIEINAKPSMVFQVPDDLPEAVQPLDGNWEYEWVFRQVFSDEVGGFNEVPDIWS